MKEMKRNKIREILVHYCSEKKQFYTIILKLKRMRKKKFFINGIKFKELREIDYFHLFFWLPFGQ